MTRTPEAKDTTAQTAETTKKPSTQADPHIHLAPCGDGSHAMLTLEIGRKKMEVELDQGKITDLIVALGAMRQMMGGNTTSSIEGASFTPVRRTSWALQLDPEAQGSILAFQHPAFGPIGLALTDTDAARLSKGLELHRTLNATTMKASGPLN